MSLIIEAQSFYFFIMPLTDNNADHRASLIEEIKWVVLKNCSCWYKFGTTEIK